LPIAARLNQTCARLYAWLNQKKPHSCCILRIIKIKKRGTGGTGAPDAPGGLPPHGQLWLRWRVLCKQLQPIQPAGAIENKN